MWLAGQLESRASAAVVRFGDGEHNVLDAQPGNADSLAGPAERLKAQAGSEFPPDAVFAVRRQISRAFEEADVLGILIGYSFDTSRPNGLTSLYLEHWRAGRRPALLANCHLHQDIVERLPSLLAGRRVSVISCRDVAPVLEGEWGLSDVAVYQVPSQCNARDVDGPYEKRVHSVRIWPGRLAELQSEITVREPGEVFLVGAGLFGKGLCIQIRDQGGLALDLGSALDRVVGKITRGAMRRIFLLHAQGHSPGAIAAHLEEKYGVAVDPRKVELLIDDPTPHATDNPHKPKLSLG